MEDSDEFETDFSTDTSPDASMNDLPDATPDASMSVSADASPDEPSDTALRQAAFHAASETVDFHVDYEHSGDRRVDDALDRLARLPDTPLSGHADVYDTVHTELRAILSEQPAGTQGQR